MKSPRTEADWIWEYFDRSPEGRFVEVGANDPQAGSATWFLEQQGWTGVLVEPLPRFTVALTAARPRSRVFQVACAAPGHPPTALLSVGENSMHSTLAPRVVDAGTKYVGEEIVRLTTLDELLREAGVLAPDLVSIDVEGMQLEVLKGFTLATHHPRLLLVEDHLLNWDTHRHLRRHGYRLVKRTGQNNWYVPEAHPFTLTTLRERLQLWRKVWPGTPFRRFKAWLHSSRLGP